MIDFSNKFNDYIDELLAVESKISLVSNNNFTWKDSNIIKLNNINTGMLYDTNCKDMFSILSSPDIDDSITLKLTKDNSFTFAIDCLDEDEIQASLQAASALARQYREVIIPTIERDMFSKIYQCAGTIENSENLTSANIYEKIIEANEVLDEGYVSEQNRCIVVSHATYLLLKKSKKAILDTNINNYERLKGILGKIDDLNVIKVPASRLPHRFGFAIIHPSAVVTPVRLESFRVHQKPPGLKGDLVEGRVLYDTFVLDGKNQGIYYYKECNEL